MCAPPHFKHLHRLLMSSAERANAHVMHVLHPPEAYAGPDIHIPILYHDKDFLIVSKPAGIRIDGDSSRNPTVESLLRKRYPDYALKNVHQLDWITSGVYTFALNRPAARNASKCFMRRETSKEYVAVVEGWVAEDSFTIKKAIDDSAPAINGKKKVHAMEEGSIAGKEAETVVKVLRRGYLRQHDAGQSRTSETLPISLPLSADPVAIDPGNNCGGLSNKRAFPFDCDHKQAEEKSQNSKDKGDRYESSDDVRPDRKIFATIDASSRSTSISSTTASADIPKLPRRSTSGGQIDVCESLESDEVPKSTDLASSCGAKEKDAEGDMEHVAKYATEDDAASSSDVIDKAESENNGPKESNTSSTANEVIFVNLQSLAPIRATLVQLCPKTGRQHQLRCHLSSIGHPIVGDLLYGASAEAYVVGGRRVFLHARCLCIPVRNRSEAVVAQTENPFEDSIASADHEGAFFQMNV